MELSTSADFGADEWSDPDVVFHGEVVERRDGSNQGWRTVTIRDADLTRPLMLTNDRVDLRVAPTPLPSSLTAHPTWALDHIVHMWCGGGQDPEAIEEFLEATRGVAARYTIGREAWLEVLAHPTDRDGAETDQPLFDDIFLGRYRDLASLEQLDRDPAWSGHYERLRQRTTTVLDVALVPKVNRIAEHR